MTRETGEKILDTNRQALRLYEITDHFEAGISLLGTEVKSLRSGGSNLRDCFARVTGGEVFVYNWHIAPYSHGNIVNHEPLRTRKLLLRKSEIRKLAGLTRSTGLTLVPLKVYLKDGRIKLEIGVGRGRKLHDKREAVKRKEMKREADRAAGARR